MFFMLTISSSFVILYMLSAFAVISSSCPLYCILFLILCFFNASGFLICAGIELVSISFVLIYVGAIAVLLVFLVMMLNIKLVELKHQILNFYPFIIVYFLLGFLAIMISQHMEYFNYLLVSNDFIFYFSELFSSIDYIWYDTGLNIKHSNTFVLSKALYTVYSFQFVLCSLILLVAMLATIVLTLYKGFWFKTQTIYLQILADFNFELVNYQ